jgi:hypothetical protein
MHEWSHTVTPILLFHPYAPWMHPSSLGGMRPRIISRIADVNKFNLSYYVSNELNWNSSDPLEIFILEPLSKKA